MLRFSIQVVLLLSVFAFAWLRGGKPERFVASIYIGVLASGIVHRLISGGWSEGGYDTLQAHLFATDLAALGLIVLAALRYDRWWTLWVGSAQFLAVLAHLLKAFQMPIDPKIYAAMERWPVWLALLLTAAGTTLYMRRQAMQPTITLPRS